MPPPTQPTRTRTVSSNIPGHIQTRIAQSTLAGTGFNTRSRLGTTGSPESIRTMVAQSTLAGTVFNTRSRLGTASTPTLERALPSRSRAPVRPSTPDPLNRAAPSRNSTGPERIQTIVAQSTFAGRVFYTPSRLGTTSTPENINNIQTMAAANPFNSHRRTAPNGINSMVAASALRSTRHESRLNIRTMVAAPVLRSTRHESRRNIRTMVARNPQRRSRATTLDTIQTMVAANPQRRSATTLSNIRAMVARNPHSPVNASLFTRTQTQQPETPPRVPSHYDELMAFCRNQIRENERLLSQSQPQQVTGNVNFVEPRVVMRDRGRSYWDSIFTSPLRHLKRSQVGVIGGWTWLNGGAPVVGPTARVPLATYLDIHWRFDNQTQDEAMDQAHVSINRQVEQTPVSVPAKTIVNATNGNFAEGFGNSLEQMNNPATKNFTVTDVENENGEYTHGVYNYNPNYLGTTEGLRTEVRITNRSPQRLAYCVNDDGELCIVYLQHDNGGIVTKTQGSNVVGYRGEHALVQQNINSGQINLAGRTQNVSFTVDHTGNISGITGAYNLSEVLGGSLGSIDHNPFRGVRNLAQQRLANANGRDPAEIYSEHGTNARTRIILPHATVRKSETEIPLNLDYLYGFFEYDGGSNNIPSRPPRPGGASGFGPNAPSSAAPAGP